MEIVLLGTGTPIPDPNRAGPATLLKVAELEHVLVDAGRACTMRMAAVGSLPTFLSGVLITHLHSDHVTDLNDLITTHWIMQNERRPLRIWGPVGLREHVDRLLESLAVDIGYRLAHHDDLTHPPDVEVTEVGPGDRFTVGTSTVTVHATNHRPVEPTVGYRLEHGHYVVALAGDTVPCAGLDELCADADAYVQTVVRDDLLAARPIARLQDVVDYHSTVTQAAQTAAENRVGRLVLTHLVPAPSPDDYADWIAVAQEHFDGEIVIGGDLTVVDLVER